jgi:pilus assembly protein CpaF
MTANEPSSINSPDIAKIKTYLINLISRELESNPPSPENRREAVIKTLQLAYQSTKLQLANTIREQLFHDIQDEMLGYGPIQSLLDDDDVSEIMVNSPKSVYVERKGKLVKTKVTFENEDAVVRVIDRIILPLGRRVDHDRPMVDARLPDGSRVNAIVRPIAIDGPGITIRKFQKERLEIDDLINFGSITKIMADFLRACVVSRLNLVISGGTGSGKTTLLNILSGFIPENERIVTIEDAAELQLQQDHVLRMETKPSDLNGKNAVQIRDLVRNSLRMRPDRIVVGECRGGEALDMLQAMNTGHDGSLTTLHANTPRDAISRLETMCLMSGLNLPLKVVREQIASAVDVIVQQSRLRDGSRKVTSITEVAGMEGDMIIMTEVFRFEQTGISEDEKVIGELKPSGIRPMFMPRLMAAGFKLGPEVFGADMASILSNRNNKSRRR